MIAGYTSNTIPRRTAARAFYYFRLPAYRLYSYGEMMMADGHYISLLFYPAIAHFTSDHKVGIILSPASDLIKNRNVQPFNLHIPPQ